MRESRLSVVHSCPTWLSLTQRWLYEQVRALPPEVYSSVVCEGTANLDEFNVPNLYRFADLPIWRRFCDRLPRRLGLRRHLSFLSDVARRENARIIHSHFGHVGWADRGAAAKARVRHVVTFYGSDISQAPETEPAWRDRYRQLFQSVDRVLCEGPHMRQRAIELGCPAEKALVHHLGIDLKRASFQPRSLDVDGPLRVLLAGTFREKKGIPLAIRALAELRARRRIDLQITIIGDAAGKPGDAEEKARIVDAIHRGGLESRCRLLGFQPYDVLMREAAHHHVFLSPSITASDGDSEGGAPISILDMAATGLIIVSSRHCDIPNIIEDRISGVLAAERDLEGLVDGLGWLLDNRAAWAPIATAARKRVAQEFDCVEQGRKLAATYQSLC